MTLQSTNTDMTAADNVNKDINKIVMAITSKAPNVDQENTNATKSRSPHFMSPTVSSSRQMVTKSPKVQDQMSTHTKRNQWLASAAKRVGFNRTSDGMSRSRKEGMSPEAIPFPDKFVTPANVKLPDTSPSTITSVTTPLSEKPLPSPPIAQVSGTSLIPAARSLLDASERPLRRSPPGMPHKQEDWPALIPQKNDQRENPSADPNTAPSMSLLNEFYPNISNVSHVLPAQDHKAHMGQSARRIHRKEVSSVKHLEKSGITWNIAKTENATSDHEETRKNISIFPDTPSVADELATHSVLSASAAAVEKSAYEAGSAGQPRQTHTSSLRARLSAGQLIAASPVTKPRVVGFTDFTVYNDTSTEPNLHGLHAPDSIPSRSVSPQGASLSKESLHVNRTPAQFVGGSQIPIVSRRSSRSSLRGDRRAPSPFFAPQAIEQLNSTTPKVINIPSATNSLKLEAPKVSEPRRSSIPIFRHTVSNIVLQAEKEEMTPGNNQNADPRAEKNPSNKFGIFESCAPAPWQEEGVDLAVDPTIEGKVGDFSEFVKNIQHTAGLEAIEESPKQDFHLKRLSLASPELGPSLKIAKSAGRLIMGSDSDKENQPDPRLKKNTSHRRVAGKLNVQQTIQSTGSMKTLRKETKRPSSSQGLSTSAHTSLGSKEMREKKAKSADLSYSLPTDHLRFQSTSSKSQVSLINSKDSLMDDPFFDARSFYEQGKTVSEVSTGSELRQVSQIQCGVGEVPWISPISYNHNHPSSSKADPMNTEKPLASHEYLNDKLNAEEDVSDGANPPYGGIEISQEPVKTSEKSIKVQIPFTPQKEVRQVDSSNSSSFPPRNSSRTTPPDYTANESRKKSPISPLAVKNFEFPARQNKLGACKGLASAQWDLGSGSFKRDSAAQDSYGSRSSLSKGMLSNLRGFFHKRNSDQDSLSSYWLNKKAKQKVSICANGSPFPPASEIHPIYRPTLCSKNRSVIRSRKSVFDPSIKTPTTPSFASPLPSEISTTTSLALQLFESVRTESSSPKKERSLEMGTILVEAITQAREAEKAVQEARNAARKAEMAHAMCKKTVADIASRVQEWKDEMDKM